MEVKQQNNQNKPKWLKRLEEESWQAELIISGLALYGSLQLPPFVYQLVDFLIGYLPVEQYFVGYGIVYMLLLGVSILSAFFIIHFVLRAYWVGLIGLNSVFPKGYSTDGEFFSPIYVKKFTSLLPEVIDSIKKIDEICSTLFAGAFAFLMMYGTLAGVLTGLLILYNLLSKIISSNILLPFFYLLGIAFWGVLILGMIANMKRFRENEKMQHTYYLAAKYFGYFLSPIFFKPINQITMTFYSGYKKGKSGLGMTIAFMAIAVVLSMTHVDNSNVKVLILKGRADIPVFQKNRTYPEFYKDSYPKQKAVVNPIIPSEEISGAFLKVFIPVFDNEEFIQEKFCEPYINDDSKSRLENRRIKSEQKLFCYRKYHKVYVNDSLYQVEFLKHELPDKLEFGLLGYIPTANFRIGKNELKTVKLSTVEGEIHDELTIPFWFTGE